MDPVATLRLLPPIDRSLVDVLSVVYGEINLTNLTKILATLGTRSPAGKSWTTTTLRPCLEDLAASKLLLNADGFRCAPAFREPATRLLAREGRLKAIATAVGQAVDLWGGYAPPRSEDEALRMLRVALYLGDVEGTLLHQRRAFPYLERPLCRILANPLDEALVRALDPRIVEALAEEVLGMATLETLRLRKTVTALLAPRGKSLPGDLQLRLAADLVWEGNLPEAYLLVSSVKATRKAALLARMALLSGDGTEEALSRAFSLLGRPPTGRAPGERRDAFFHATIGIAVGTPVALEGAGEALGGISTPAGWDLLDMVAFLGTGKVPSFLEPTGEVTEEVLFQGLARRWCQRPLSKALVGKLEALAEAAGEAGLEVLHREVMAVLGRAEGGVLVGLIRPVEPWERKLEALRRAATPVEPALPKAEGRLAWFLTLAPYGAHIAPKEQKASGKGWTGGRVIALPRLKFQPEEFPFLEEADRRVVEQLQVETVRGPRGYPETNSVFVMPAALLALVGHPRVFWAESGGAVRVKRAQPLLLVEARKEEFLLTFAPAQVGNCRVRRLSGEAVEVVVPTPEQEQVAGVIGEGLKIPRKGAGELAKALRVLAGVIEVEGDVVG